MIEGLRLLPHYQHAADVEFLLPSTCEDCKAHRDAHMRQQMGCPFEAAVRFRPYLWAPVSWRKRGVEPTVCPGYTTRLPLVEEIVSVFPQWEAGTLVAWLDGQPTTRPLLDALAHRKAGRDDFQRAQLEEAEAERKRRAGGR